MTLPCTRRTWLAASVMLVALAVPFVPTVSAHAPIEWSEPKAYSVVPEIPDTVKVRFANEPVSVTMRTIEPEPRSGVTLKPVRISERTYEVTLWKANSCCATPCAPKVLVRNENRSEPIGKGEDMLPTCGKRVRSCCLNRYWRV